MTNGYALGELARALRTAAGHEDPQVRERARDRVENWIRVLDGITHGELRPGSRPPAAFPAWVTLEVVRGGFATGRAVAAGPMEDDEIALARRLGVPAERRLLFAHYLTDTGLAELGRQLDAGTYRIRVPEDAALLVVAWLVREGDRAEALELLAELAPYVDLLRFVPRSATAPTMPPDHVQRMTAGQARTALRERREQELVEAQREALTVWNPFADRALALWLEVPSRLPEASPMAAPPSGRPVSLPADAGPLELSETWHSRAAELLVEYDRLAATHRRCMKHRNPRENLAILLRALREAVEGRTAPDRDRGLVRVAVAGMAAERGLPDFPEHAIRRADERESVHMPSHARLAGIAAHRLSDLDFDEGLPDPGALDGPVNSVEAASGPVPAGTPMPEIVSRILSRATRAKVETLFERDLIPSAEVLAELAPTIGAAVIGGAHPDPALGSLMAANHRAFRRRRSLLLLNLESQVRLAELPWVRATIPHGTSDAADEALGLARRLGALAIDHFPATILPNPLIQELSHLFRVAEHEVPLVEELAADIFMGRFADSFRQSALAADPVLRSTVYAAYYGIDYDRLAETLRSRPWSDLANEAFDRMVALLDLASRQDCPLATIKNAAYAWRQTLFFLSLDTSDAAEGFLAGARARSDVPGVPAILAGLEHVLAGGRFDPNGGCPVGHRFLGWTTGRHWILDEAGFRT